MSLTDENANIIEHRSYDPFGKPRKGDFLTVNPPTITAAIGNVDPHTNRGFTDHEHLDEMQLIHMNGRVYDYNIGRFTSVDPFIQAPNNSQSINPYSYIMNNPLAGTDPTGYAACGGKGENPCPELKVKKVAVTGSRIKNKTEVTDSNGNSRVYDAPIGAVTKAIDQINGAYQVASGNDTSTMGSRAKDMLQAGADILLPNAQNVDLSESTSISDAQNGFFKAGGNLLDDLGNSLLDGALAGIAATTGVSIGGDLIPEMNIAGDLTPAESIGGGVFDVVTLGAAGSVKVTTRGAVVANTAKTARTVLYQKVGSAGEHLKFGITNNPLTRYTSAELNGGRLRTLATGPRKEMLSLERRLHETLPIGSQEAQKFYIRKQVEKGLRPPPYKP